MANNHASNSSFRSLLLFSLYFVQAISTSHQVYIVYLGNNRHNDPFLTSDYHVRLLADAFDQSQEEARQSLVYSYRHVFSGFAATLNETQATVLENKEGVISVFKSKIMRSYTTRSWDFMGLTLNHTHKTDPLQLAHGGDIIVGLIDSGVWPESASFMEDPGMGPTPGSWKGKCVSGPGFNPKKACNKKLIGARYYLNGFEREFGSLNTSDYPEFRSPRDIVGHGTHTASIAVGSRSSNASLLGFAGGIARGGAPRARLAVYKACWSRGLLVSECMEEDTLAAFDDALNDGVDVLSISFGSDLPSKAFFRSSADIGSFHAMQLGVSVVFAAGNTGPVPSLVQNVNPWSICVGASTMDRSFPTKIVFKDSSSFVGEGLIVEHITGVLARAVDHFFDGICNTKNWNRIPASGKILVCFHSNGNSEHTDAEYAAYKANASALIFVQPLTMPAAALSVIPVVQIDTIQGSKLYLKSYDFVDVQILPSDTAFKRSPEPMVSQYSSRGPSSISPDFIKPDISAPGTNILAAWPPTILPSVFWDDHRSLKWNLLSGTSMACPHVSGVVALIKSAQPKWSPAAIKSALMTTAYNADINDDDILVQGSTQPSGPFDIGSGHMNPTAAFDPGLIYDMTTQDYVHFLCNIGYSDSHVRAMFICDAAPSCPRCSDLKPKSNWNLNYPSITVSNLNCTTTVWRTVRHVGPVRAAAYFVSIENPNGVEVDVWPRVLTFSYLNQDKTYCVILRPQKVSQGRFDFSWITWSDGFHQILHSPPTRATIFAFVAKASRHSCQKKSFTRGGNLPETIPQPLVPTPIRHTFHIPHIPC